MSLQAHAAPGTPPVLSEAADVTLESLSRQAGWDDETFVEGSRLRSEGQVSALPAATCSVVMRSSGKHASFRACTPPSLTPPQAAEVQDLATVAAQAAPRDAARFMRPL